MSRKQLQPPAPPKAPAALLLMLSIDRETAVLSMCGNADGERDLTLLQSSLRLAQESVQKQLIEAAVARGAAGGP